jgi:hypothetical protein
MRRLLIVLIVLLARPALAAEKFALAVYHFNVQYVQGGLIGFPDGESMSETFNLNEQQVEDQIIRESFDPLLDLYARHPTWGADFEMQGYMLDVIVQRHPSTLAKMKALAAAGKVSFDSFHWSDQFWIAYPRVDMERSHDLVVKSFKAAGIPLGTSIFTQEGQFSIGMERFFRERGIKTAIVAGGVVGSTLNNYPTEALNTLGPTPDVLALVAPCGGSGCEGYKDDQLDVIWDWRDDGELAVTGKSDPYLGVNFKFSTNGAALFEQQLVDEETAGYQHTSVADYVQRALALGVQPKPLPEVVEGVWHHDVFLWMGGTSIEDAVRPGTSADNAVHTLAVKAHRKLRAAEDAVAQLKTHEFDARIEAAWKDLLLGQCSDGSGQNPWLAEREYSQRHSQAALDAANAILSDRRISAHIVPSPVSAGLSEAAKGPFEVAIDPTAHRVPSVTWKKHDDGDLWELFVSFPAIADDARDLQRHTVQIDFPRTGDDLIWSGALEDEKVRTLALANVSGTDVSLPDGGTEPVAMVPAANGLLGLGNGLYLIERTETIHLAAQFPRNERVLRFKDATATTDAIEWKFIVVKGTEAAALQEALAANVNPDPLVPAKGCGCNMSAADGGAGLLFLLGLLGRKRRARVLC